MSYGVSDSAPTCVVINLEGTTNAGIDCNGYLLMYVVCHFLQQEHRNAGHHTRIQSASYRNSLGSRGRNER